MSRRCQQNPMWVELAVVSKPVPPFLRSLTHLKMRDGHGGGGRDRGPAVMRLRPFGQSELSYPGVAAHSWGFLFFFFHQSQRSRSKGGEAHGHVPGNLLRR